MQIVFSPLLYFVFLFNNYFGYDREFWLGYQITYATEYFVVEAIKSVIPLLMYDYILKMLAIYAFTEGTLSDFLILTGYYGYYTAILFVISLLSSQIYPRYIPQQLFDKNGGFRTSFLFMLFSTGFIILSHYNMAISGVSVMMVSFFLFRYIRNHRFKLLLDLILSCEEIQEFIRDKSFDDYLRDRYYN